MHRARASLEPFHAQGRTAQVHHHRHQAGHAGGIGPAAERNDKTARAALAEVIEKPQRDRPGKFLFLEVWGILPRCRRAFGADRRKVREVEPHRNPAGTAVQPRGETARAGLGRARRVDVHDSTGDIEGEEREPWAHRHHPPAGGDHRPAVVDRPPGLVAHQVRVHVRHAQRSRALQHQPLPHVVLAEREVAGRRIEDDVRPFQRQRPARTIRHPGVFADLKADLHAADVKVNVANGVALALQFRVRKEALRPGLEPPGLVVQTLAGEEPLGHKAEDSPIRHQAGRVEQGVVVQHRQAERDDNPAASRAGSPAARPAPGAAGPASRTRPRTRIRRCTVPAGRGCSRPARGPDGSRRRCWPCCCPSPAASDSAPPRRP